MGFRAVLFDVGDTLWHSAEAPPPAEFRRLASMRAKQYLAGANVAPRDDLDVSRIAWDAVELAMQRARQTDRVEPDYAEVARNTLAESGLSLSHQHAVGLLDAIYVSGVDGGKAAYPDARTTLDTLRLRGFKLAIVSNRAFGGDRFRDDLRAAGLDIDWDATIVSVEVGYLKPHPEIFRCALAALDIPAHQALMVGNSLAEDIAGAQALGISAAWKRFNPDAEGVRPDFTFDEVSELLDWPPLEKALDD